MAVSNVNLLNIPQNIYGLAGIRVGNLIYEHVTNHGYGILQYNSKTHKITVLTTPGLTFPVLNNILYNTPRAHEYAIWQCYPVIEKSLNNEGHLEISLSPLKSDSSVTYVPVTYNGEVDYMQVRQERS